jgi:hypothetical protein
MISECRECHLCLRHSGLKSRYPFLIPHETMYFYSLCHCTGVLRRISISLARRPKGFLTDFLYFWIHLEILWSARKREARSVEVVSASSSLLSQLLYFQKSKSDLYYLKDSEVGRIARSRFETEHAKRADRAKFEEKKKSVPSLVPE